MSYASQPIVTVSICLSRLSILLLYARIFRNYMFLVCLNVMYILNRLWGAVFTLFYLLQCVPPKEYWDVQQGKRQHCISSSINYYYAISTIILDVLFLAMPWPVIWRLQMAVKHKFSILAVFMLGAVYVRQISFAYALNKRGFKVIETDSQ